MAEMICPKCKYQVKEYEKFCTNCGHEIRRDSQNAVPVATKKAKTWLIILIVAIVCVAAGVAIGTFVMMQKQRNQPMHTPQEKAKILQFVAYENLIDSNGNPNPQEGAPVIFDDTDIILDGEGIESATAETRMDEVTGTSEPIVEIKFTARGKRDFSEITRSNIGMQLAIVYKGKLLSAPTIKSAITEGICVISGGFESYEEAEALARALR